MRVVFAGDKERGASCLRAVLVCRHDVAAVVAGPRGAAVAEAAAAAGIPVSAPADVNAPEVGEALAALEPDVVVLVGYGQIVQQHLLDLAPHGCVNLHAGKLPEYRGSSPLNWALINGESEFTLSLIRVDAGVDTGDVLAERAFPIGADDTIADLHRVANEAFPELLLAVLDGLESGAVQPRPQDESAAGYYPLRFPEDGLILWDQHTALEVHNRVRALTDPYPGAFTFHEGRRVKLLHSRLSDRAFYGEPGRVYVLRDGAALVCASDRCLWIDRALSEDGADALERIRRYDRLATVRDLATAGL